MVSSADEGANQGALVPRVLVQQLLQVLLLAGDAEGGVAGAAVAQFFHLQRLTAQHVHHITPNLLLGGVRGEARDEHVPTPHRLHHPQSLPLSLAYDGLGAAPGLRLLGGGRRGRGCPVLHAALEAILVVLPVGGSAMGGRGGWSSRRSSD